MRGGWKKGLGIVAATACSLAMMLSGGAIASADDTTDTTGGYTFELGEPTGPVYTDLLVSKGFTPVDGGMIPRMPVTVGNLTVGKEYCVGVGSSDDEPAWPECARATATTQTFHPFMGTSFDDGSIDENYNPLSESVSAYLTELGSSQLLGESAAKSVETSSLRKVASLSGLNPVPASMSANVSFNYAIDPSLNGKVAGMCVYTFIDRTFTYDNPQGLAPYGWAGAGGNPSYCDNGTTHTRGVTTLQTEHMDGRDNADNRVPDAITETFQRFTQYAALDFNKDLNAALSGSASFTLPSLFAGTKYGNWNVLDDIEAYKQKHVDDPNSSIAASVQVKFVDGSYTDYMSSTNLPDFTTLAANASKPTPSKPGSSAPSAPVEKDLTEGTKNTGLLGTDSLTAGDAVSLNVGKQYAGDKVDVYLFSTPRKIASAVTVASDGMVKVTVPSDVPAGAHRIAVKLWSDPSKLVWDSVTVKAAAHKPGTNGSDNTAGTDTQKPTQPTDNTKTQKPEAKPQAKTDTLPKGGAGVMTVVAIMLVLAAVAGATVVIRRRA